MTATAVYLDASAAVKLLRREPETDALRWALTNVTSRVSSELLEVELRCVARRQEDPAALERSERVLAGIDLLPFTPAIRARAGEAFDPPQRSLDALHLATALDLGIDGLLMLTYDARQARAARAADMRVEGPA